MNFVRIEDVNRKKLETLPPHISNPQILFGEGNFYLFENRDAICCIKVEKKVVFKIATLTGMPYLKHNQSNEKKFLNEVILYLKEYKICDRLEPTLHFFMCNKYPNNSYVSKIGALVVDLTIEEKQLLKNFSSNYRNEIKKVKKEKYEIVKDVDLVKYWELYNRIQQRQNLYTYPKSYFENLLKIKGLNSYFWVINVNEKAEGFISVIQYNNQAYYLFGGATFPTQFAGSNKLLQHELMLELKEAGVEKYYLGGFRLGNIEGSKYKGIQDYKKRFGAEIEQKVVFYTKIAAIKSFLYKVLLLSYLKLKGIKTNTQGLNYVYEKA